MRSGRMAFQVGDSVYRYSHRLDILHFLDPDFIIRMVRLSTFARRDSQWAISARRTYNPRMLD
jgi:hypothetical protein